MEYNKDQPIYIQLVDKIKGEIISGELQPGARLDSVRDMAERLKVNPNTMQRALAELEREELVYTERTSGRYVTTDEHLITALRDSEAQRRVREFLQSMHTLGYGNAQLIHMIEKYKEGDSADGTSNSKPN
ncbi:MAG: GntR family transcriptional regulator [Eubacteriales bacterium]